MLASGLPARARRARRCHKIVDPQSAPTQGSEQLDPIDGVMEEAASHKTHPALTVLNALVFYTEPRREKRVILCSATHP